MPKELPPSHLTAHLGFWLRFLSNHVSHAFARKVEAKGVTVAEWVVMRELYAVEAEAPSRIAEKIGMTRGAITKLGDRLLAKALAVRKPNLEDARAQTLALTAKGRKLVPELAALADENDAEFFDHLSQADRKALLRILKDVIGCRSLKTIPTN